MKKKLFIRIGIVIAIITIVSFSDWSFAADNKPLTDVANITNFLTQILSRIWVIFARLAGEFLTNKWVYGEVLGLDALLWKYWVVVRNLANFGLGLFFTYTIFMALFKKEDTLKNFKNIILRLLIAGIGIQTSWFFTAVVMDVSTVTLVSVGSVPSQIISQNSELEKNFTTSLNDYLTGNVVLSGKNLILFPKEGTANNFLQVIPVKIEEGHEISKEEFLDDLLPKYDSVSGPLYYMGIAILDSFNISNIPVDSTNKNGVKKTILNTILHGGTTIVYSIEMMVLCVVALLRVFYLWMFITLSPIAILIYCLKKADSDSIGKLLNSESLKDLMDNLNFSSFFINAFKPTIIVLGISLSVVFVSAMKGIIIQKHNTTNFEGVSLSSTCSQMSPSIKCETHVDSELYEGIFKNLSKTFMDIILSVITVILVYEIIKISVGIGKGNDFVSKRVEKMQGNIGDIISKTPIIPIGSKDENGKPLHLSLGTAFGLGSNRGLIKEKIGRMQNKVDLQSAEQTSAITEAFFGNDNILSDAQKEKIEKAGRYPAKIGIAKLDAKKEIIESIRTKEGRGMVLDPNAADPFWRNEFTFWLNERVKNGDYNSIADPDRRTMITDWKALNPQDETKRKLEDLFNKSKHAQTYAKYFGYSGTYKDFNSIKDLDISQKPSS